jgi:hypothetical protein
MMFEWSTPDGRYPTTSASMSSQEKAETLGTLRYETLLKWSDDIWAYKFFARVVEKEKKGEDISWFWKGAMGRRERDHFGEEWRSAYNRGREACAGNEDMRGRFASGLRRFWEKAIVKQMDWYQERRILSGSQSAMLPAHMDITTTNDVTAAGHRPPTREERALLLPPSPDSKASVLVMRAPDLVLVWNKFVGSSKRRVIVPYYGHAGYRLERYKLTEESADTITTEGQSHLKEAGIGWVPGAIEIGTDFVDIFDCVKPDVRAFAEEVIRARKDGTLLRLERGGAKFLPLPKELSGKPGSVRAQVIDEWKQAPGRWSTSHGLLDTAYAMGASRERESSGSAGFAFSL